MNSPQLLIHTNRLSQMYGKSPIHQNCFLHAKLEFETDLARIILPEAERYHHAGGGVHGSVFFKLLDDAAYFSAQKTESTFFLLTQSFQIRFLRPGKSGILKAEGRIRHQGKDHWICESRVFDEKGRELAYGEGQFVRSALKLEEVPLFANPLPE